MKTAWLVALIVLASVALAAPCALAAETGLTEGTVVSVGEKLTVKPAAGDEVTFWVKWIEKDGKWIREPLVNVALTKGALRKGMPVVVEWSIGEQGRKYIDKLIATGTVTGTVVEPREKGILLVKVEGVDEPMRFVTRWIQREGKWIPNPEDVEKIASVATGAKVSVTYELEEHLRINELKVVE